MSGGRGQFLLSLKEGLERAQPGRHGRTKKRRLPPEIILKIFSYLDVESLFCVGFVNRQFNELANDNATWYDLFVYEAAKKKWRLKLGVMEKTVSTQEQDMPAVYWKKLLFSNMGFHKDMDWKKELTHINPYTGMPQQTEQVLRNLRVGWEITLTHKDGQQRVCQQNWAFFSDSSVTVCWNTGVWPYIRQVLTLQIHGVVCPSASTSSYKPRWRSLISKIKVCSDKRWKFFGADCLVNLLQFDDGITVGLWRGTWKIAFVMATLHFHQLVERSLLGTVFCPYRTAEIIPMYNEFIPEDSFHGYSVLILLDNSVRRIMHCRYSPVLCTIVEDHREYVHFRPSNVYNMSPWPNHTPVSGEISLPWKAEGLEGDIKNCCMMTVSVLDEAQRPVWCISSPAGLVLPFSHVTSESHDEEQFVLRYDDDDGKVRVKLMWMQDLQLYFLDGLHIWIRLTRVNAHYRRIRTDVT
ncbi:F-box only protein 15-like isoform X1 [Trichomycterus rosablanca]|uniref:F-box only protein 15-like isoform X1 n=1 Tax=Trichomycterus rosablanca TaxID=2290929 RepID=UPI002F35D144